MSRREFFNTPPNGQVYNGYRVAGILRDRAAEIRGAR